jgi:hypothetical protein
MMGRTFAFRVKWQYEWRQGSVLECKDSKVLVDRINKQVLFKNPNFLSYMVILVSYFLIFFCSFSFFFVKLNNAIPINSNFFFVSYNSSSYNQVICSSISCHFIVYLIVKIFVTLYCSILITREAIV